MANNDCWNCATDLADENANFEPENASTRDLSASQSDVLGPNISRKEPDMVFIPREQMSITVPEKCVRCKKPGLYLCSRCHETYCSSKCQAKHWPIHRYHCVPMPYPLRIALNKAARMQEAIADRTKPTKSVTTQTEIKSHIIIPSGTLVVISYVLNQKFVFVRPATSDDEANYLQTLQEILIFAETAAPIQQAPQCGQVLLALHENNYYRVFISHVYDSGFVIVAKLDFGDIVQLPVSKLFALSDELKTRPIFVRKIKLCETESKSSHQINYLLELKETEQQLMLKYEGEWSPAIECNLFNADTDESINEELAKLQGVPSPLPQMDEYIEYDRVAEVDKLIKFKKVQGEHIEMLVLDNSMIKLGYISCIEFNEWETLMKQNDAINKYCRKSSRSVYKPQLYEMCLALHFADYRWYRAMCIDLQPNEKALMHFIDTGRVDRILFTDIMRLPDQFAFDCAVTPCYIDGLVEVMQSDMANDYEKKKYKVYAKIVFDSVQYDDEGGICKCTVKHP